MTTKGRHMTEKPWPMEGPALELAFRLESSEVLKIDEETAALIIEQGGVDYVVTMTRAPKQRTRQ